jgi:hypothetical protein
VITEAQIDRVVNALGESIRQLAQSELEVTR